MERRHRRGSRGHGAAPGGSPRRWRAATGAALAGLAVVAACGTDREVTRPEPEPVTEDGLRAALLTAADIPGATGEAPSDTPVGAELLEAVICDDPITELAPELEASSTVTTPAVELTSTVAWFPGGGRAAVDAFNRLRNDCRRAVDLDSGLSVRASQLALGALTDRVLAIQLELEPTTGPITEVAVIVLRDGDLVYVLRATGERPISRELLDTATRRALGSVSALARTTGQ